jgi:hypothetical protein
MVLFLAWNFGKQTYCNYQWLSCMFSRLREDIMHTLFYLLSCKTNLGKTRVQLIMKEAVNLDRVGAVALEHTIFTKGILLEE